ncbi:MAG: MFS transporter [Acidimicrobiales bacterium]|nr:MFS transporter [Acidimicrobiales bacterium]
MADLHSELRSNELSMAGLVGLTAGKTVVNMGLRWIPFFLPNLGRAFGASTAGLTTVLGIGEMAGLLTAATGRQLDRGRERLIITAGMALVGASTVLAIVGTFVVFALSQFLLILGISLYTVGGHAYISRHVAFARRGRAIGIFEVSWALGLLVGAPVAALLIEGISWRAPFIAVGLMSLVACVLLIRIPEDPALVRHAPASPRPTVQLDNNAWMAIGASAGIALAGLTTIVIAGTWMEDRLGISTGGIGAVAMGFGAVELLSSSGSARFSDRFGKNRSTRVALLVLCGGLVVICAAQSSLLLGAMGLVLFFGGFEYAIVTSFSVVSEAMPAARGQVLSVNVATGTVARGVGSVSSGFLYEGFGIIGPAALSVVGAVAGFALLGRVRSE